MNKRTIESELLNLFEETIYKTNHSDYTPNLQGLKKVRTFSDLGLMTTDNGIVLDFESNEQFQITIKRSK